MTHIVLIYYIRNYLLKVKFKEYRNCKKYKYYFILFLNVFFYQTHKVGLIVKEIKKFLMLYFFNKSTPVAGVVVDLVKKKIYGKRAVRLLFNYLFIVYYLFYLS